MQRLSCAISLHWGLSARALFALDEFGSEMRLESTTPKTRRDAACPRLVLLTTTTCRMNLCLCVCISFIFMARRRRQPCPVVSPTPCNAAPWPGAHYVLYLLVLAHRRDSTTRALGRIDTMLIAFTLEIGKLIGRADREDKTRPCIGTESTTTITREEANI